VTVNISSCGLLLESDAALEVGDELDLTLPLSGEDRISMFGVVTRVQEAREGSSGQGGQSGGMEVAVKFTRITTVDQDRLVRFILITEHRRREAAMSQA
jgi:hypothetical protein